MTLPPRQALPSCSRCRRPPTLLPPLWQSSSNRCRLQHRLPTPIPRPLRARQVTTPQGAAKGKAPEATQTGNMMEVLENTLWNRSLGSMSEEIVAALVCQIFEGACCTLCGCLCSGREGGCQPNAAVLPCLPRARLGPPLCPHHTSSLYVTHVSAPAPLTTPTNPRPPRGAGIRRAFSPNGSCNE